MKPCCELGAILTKERYRVLYESDNFFVAPTKGPMGIKGYLMVVSKKCHCGIGSIPEDQYAELEEVIETTRAEIKDVCNKDVQIFEHGPRVCDFRGGGCLDHAHLHLVPGADVLDEIAIDLMYRLDDTDLFYRVDRVEGFKRAADLFHEGKSSYFMTESPDKRRMFVEVNFFIPSQYIRQLIAMQFGTNEWNWRKFPQHDVMKRTIDAFQGRFH